MAEITVTQLSEQVGALTLQAADPLKTTKDTTVYTTVYTTACTTESPTESAAESSTTPPCTPQRTDTMDSGYHSAGEEKTKKTDVITTTQAEEEATLTQENQPFRSPLEKSASSATVATMQTDAMETEQPRPRRPVFTRSRSMMDRNAMANPGASLHKPHR